MTHHSFLIAAQAVLQIFLMGSVGFFLVRRGVLNDAGLKLLSFLSVNVCFPFFIFNQLITHFNPASQPLWWAFPLINIALGLVGLGLAWACSGIVGTQRRAEWMASAGFHNAGYIPLLLTATLPLGVMAPTIYSSVILSIIGFDLCLWTLGVWLITKKTKGAISFKNFLNPPLLSMFAAFVIVLLGFKGVFSAEILKPVKIMGDSALAIAMLTIGGNLGLTKFDHKALGEVFAAVGLKLLVLPLLALVVIHLGKFDPIFSFVLLVQSCMPTAITLSVIARHHDSSQQDYINQTIFYSHMVSLITIPLFLGFYGGLIK